MAMQFFINPKNVDRLYPWGEDAENKQHWIEVKRHLSSSGQVSPLCAGQVATRRGTRFRAM